MRRNSQAGENEPASPKEIELWVKQESADVTKSCELRLKELEELSRAYLAGEISSEQANTLKARYHDRWEDPLSVACTGPGISDEQIVKRIDEEIERQRTERKIPPPGRYR
jgi:hypothetical protein